MDPENFDSCRVKGIWRTVDDYQKVTGVDAVVTGAASHGPYTYLVGEARTREATFWIVRKSSDEGETWSTVDEIQDATATGIAADPRNGDLYVIGRGGSSSPTSVGSWVIRKSVDAGITWETVDEISSSPLEQAPVATRIGIDGFGNVSALGYRAGEFPHPGVLRRSEDGGLSWQNIDFAGPQQYSESIVCGPNGAVFIGGGIPHSSTSAGMKWNLRYSPDGKTGWETVDSLQSSSPAKIDGFPIHGAISAEGKVAFVGNAINTTIPKAKSFWVIREASLEQPYEWKTADEYLPKTKNNLLGYAEPRGVTYSKEGEIVTEGKLIFPQSVDYTLVRSGKNPDCQFHAVDLFSQKGGLAGQAVPPLLGGTGSIVCTAKGTLIAGSLFYSGRRRITWHVRKLDRKSA